MVGTYVSYYYGHYNESGHTDLKYNSLIEL